jgi:hypothetical protein
MSSNCCENDNNDYNYNEYDYTVQGRLDAYHLYTKGSVSWSHPDLDYKVICSPPKDMENPNTFEIPCALMDKYQRTKTVDSDFIDEYNCWNWGDLHCQVEELFRDGWTCEAADDTFVNIKNEPTFHLKQMWNNKANIILQDIQQVSQDDIIRKPFERLRKSAGNKDCIEFGNTRFIWYSEDPVHMKFTFKGRDFYPTSKNFGISTEFRPRFLHLHDSGETYDYVVLESWDEGLNYVDGYWVKNAYTTNNETVTSKHIILQKHKSKDIVSSKEDNNEDKPKRAISAYLYYASHRRPLLKREQPDFGFGELTKTIAYEWKEMSQKDKAPYIALAKADKERYERETQ